jgi:RNA polymerase sigma-32 factor
MSSITWTNDSDSLSRYLRQIQRYPMLSAEEEVVLARAWRDHQDIEARHKLVASHLRLVTKIAMGYRGYGLPVSDLISEGSFGMIQATKRFDPDRGFRLSTYAMWWIRAAVQEYILHNWSLVKMGTTSAQKKLFFNLRRLKGQIKAIEDGDLQPAQVTRIAHVLDVTEQDVISMNRRLGAPDHSLNMAAGEDDKLEWQDELVETNPGQEAVYAEHEEHNERKMLLSSALTTLTERELHILTERRLKENPVTLGDLSVQYGVSRERVRQIEVRAVQKLQKAVKINAAKRRRRGPVTDDTHPAVLAAMVPTLSARRTSSESVVAG